MSKATTTTAVVLPLSILLIGIWPVRATASPMRVAVIYSSFKEGAYWYRDEYDGDLGALHWSVEKVENKEAEALLKRLSEFRLLLFTATYNFEHTFDFGARAEAIREFVRGGGVLLITDPNYPQQADWLSSVDNRFRLVPGGEQCASDGGVPPVVEKAHPLFAKVQPVCAWTHPAAWSSAWQVLARCAEGRPVVLLQEYGKGLVIVTVAYRQYRFPNAQFLEDVMAFARDEERQRRAVETMALEQRALGQHRVLPVARLSRAPRIDGDLGDEAWQGASRIERFVAIDGSRFADDQTAVRVGYDDENLYFAFTCRDSEMSTLRMRETQRDGEVYHDDAVEIFLDPTGTRRSYKHFVINAAGVQFDEDSGDARWDALWFAATKRYDDHWTVEVAIPFGSLGLGDLPAVAPVWAANFNRNRPRSGELSGWAATFGSFHAPQHFGDLTDLDVHFTRFAVRGRMEPPKQWHLGDNRVQVALANATGRALAGELRLGQARARVRLAPGASATAPLSITLNGGATRLLNAQLLTQDRVVWNSALLVARAPELLQVTLVKPAYRASLYSTMPDRVILLSAAVAGLPSAEKPATLRSLIVAEGRARPIAQETRRVTKDTEVEFRFDATDYAPGTYTGRVDLQGRSGHILATISRAVRVVPPAAFEVTFDENRCCYLNGKPYFPLGLYHVSEPVRDMINAENRGLGLPPKTLKAMLAEVKAHGFNCFVRGWGMPSEEVLNAAQEAGLMVMPEIGGPPSSDLRALVSRYRADPRLLLWYGIDEAAGEHLEKALADHALFAEADPYHPVGAALNNPGTFARAAQAFDVLMPDPYPIRRQPITLISAWTDGALAAGSERKPVWLVPQAFAVTGAWHEPTPQEVRCEAYLALTHGATGLVWYAYFTTEPLKDQPKGRKQWYLPDSPLWDAFTTLNREISEIAPALLSPRVAQTIVADNPAVHLRLVRHGSRNYLLAVNVSPESVVCHLNGAVTEADVLWENRVVKATNGVWREEFGGYGVRVYRWEMKR